MPSLPRVQWRRELDAVLGGGAGDGTGGAASGEGGGGGGTSGGGGEGEGDSGAAEQLLCAQAIFDVLDTMHEWRTQHMRRNPISVNAWLGLANPNPKPNPHPHPNPNQVNAVAIGALLDAASRPQLVAAAMRCGAPCRALRYAEEHAAAETPHRVEHVVGPSMAPMVRGLTASAVALIFPAYRRTLEPDGLLRAVHERTLEEEALEHEQQGRYSAALGCYQVMLQQEHAHAHAHAQWRDGAAQPAAGGQQEPAQAQAQAQAQAAGAGAGAGAGGAALLRWRLGLCRCLRHLGLLVQMKDSADGALRHARGEGEQLALQSCALQAAWRLGSWADVHKLAQGCAAVGGGGGGGGGGEVGAAAVGRGDWAAEGEARFEAQLASAMHALQRREVLAVEAHCHAARRALAPLLVAASGASYIAAHPHVIRLQLLQERRHV